MKAPLTEELSKAAGLLNQGRATEARALARKLVQQHPGAGPAFTILGVAALRLGDLDDALARLRRATQLDPSDADALFHLGLVLQRRGDGDAAIAAFSAALTIDAKLKDAYAALAQVHAGRGEIDKAIDVLMRARTHWPNAPQMLVQIGFHHAQRGRWAEAAALTADAVAQARGAGQGSLLAQCEEILADMKMVADIAAARPAPPAAVTGIRDSWEQTASRAISDSIPRSDTMTVVFFHVDSTSDHPFLAQYAADRRSVDYRGTLQAACMAAKRTNPAARVIVLTDTRTTWDGFPGIDHVARLDVSDDWLMHSRMRAYRAAMISGALAGPTLLLDTDVALRRDFAAVFDGGFDLGLTYRSVAGMAHMPVNEGVILADLRRTDGAARAFARCLAFYDWLAEHGAAARRYGFDIRRWRGGQLSLASLVDWTVPPAGPRDCVIDGVHCRFFPCDDYNYAVQAADTAATVGGKWALHFKGAAAKDQMQSLTQG